MQQYVSWLKVCTTTSFTFRYNYDNYVKIMKDEDLSGRRKRGWLRWRYMDVVREDSGGSWGEKG